MTVCDGLHAGSCAAQLFISCLTGLLCKIDFIIQICLEVSPEGNNLQASANHS